MAVTVTKYDVVELDAVGVREAIRQFIKKQKGLDMYGADVEFKLSGQDVTAKLQILSSHNEDKK